MRIKHFYDQDTATFSYVVSDDETGQCALIDTVLNYDPQTGEITTTSADAMLEHVRTNKLTVQWILESHVHADHLSAAHYIKQRFHAPVGIGSGIKAVLQHFVPLFNTAHDTPLDASQFDNLWEDGDHFQIGNLTATVIHTPGHTPACVSYLIEDALFVGDALFVPSVGAGRCDFPGGSAASLYESVQKLYKLPDTTRVFTGHDYPAGGQAATCESTIGLQKESNCIIPAHLSKEDFVALRTKRDEGKAVPRLLYPSIQVNMRAGDLGKKESNGARYLKIPLSGPLAKL